MTSNKKPTKIHRYRIRVGKLWLHELKLRGTGARTRIETIRLSEHKRGSMLFASKLPEWATTTQDQRMRETICEQFGLSWSEFHFVAA